IDDDIRSPLGPRLFNFLCFRHERIPFSVHNAILRAKNTIHPASTGKNKSLNQRWRMKIENRHPLCSIFNPQVFWLASFFSLGVYWPLGIGTPRGPAGRAAIEPYQRFTFGKSSSFT